MTTAKTDPDAQAGEHPQAQSEAAEPAGQPPSLRAYAALLAGVGVAAVAGGYLWRGVDFAGAVLLGFAIVALNVMWTKNLVQSMLRGNGAYRALMFAAYLAKFGLTAVVLYVALVRYDVDAFGLLVGLSALVVATFLFAQYAASRQ